MIAETVAVVGTAVGIALPLLLFFVLTWRDARRNLSLAERRSRSGARVARLTLLTTVLTYLVAVVFALLAIRAANAPYEYSGSLVVILEVALQAIEIALFVWALLIVYLLLPGVVGFLMAVVPARRWRDPARILVLRGFGRDDASRTLRRLLRDRVAPLGHVYTLADRDIRIPWYVRLPVIFTQLVFLHFRQQRVRDDRTLRKLVQSMEVRWARNINWFVSWSKTFPVRSSDDCWRDVVRELGRRADLVLIDISQPSENLAWEIGQCLGGDSTARLILLTEDRSVPEARRFLERWPAAALESRLVPYDTQPGRLSELLAEGLPPGRQAQPAPRAKLGRRTHLAAAARMIGPIGFLALIGLSLLLGSAVRTQLSEPSFLERQALRLGSPGRQERALARLTRWGSKRMRTESGERYDDVYVWGVIDALKNLWDEEPSLRPEIVDLLGLVKGPFSDELLWRALRELPDEEIGRKRLALQHLKDTPLASHNTTNLLQERLTAHPDAGHRSAASTDVDLLVIEVLGEIGNLFAVRALGEIAATHPDDRVRAAAAAACERRSSPNSLRPC